MKKLVIIDTFALMHRAWHAIPPLTTKSGLMVNAVYGFTAILLKIIKELKPDYIVAAFDLPQETFRHKEYKLYKAQREAPEDEFIQQITLIEDILKALQIPKLAVPGYEADDVIGSLSRHFSKNEKDIKTTIVSGDLDTLQLVDTKTEVYTMRKSLNDTLVYDTAAVKNRYGLSPKQIIDMKALKGDASDNIPGIKGIGEKGAITLIQEFGTLEKLYENLDSDKIKPRVRELLTQQKEEAFRSKHLVTIVTDLPIKLDLKKAETENYDWNKARDIFQKLEFFSLLNKLPNSNGGVAATTGKKSQKVYTVIMNEVGMKQLAERLKKVEEFAFDTETTGLDPLTVNILGISFSWGIGEAAYIHLRDEAMRKSFKKHFTSVLESPIRKIGHNIKYDYGVLKTLGIETKGLYFDTLLAAYLVKSDRGLKLEELVFNYLKIKMMNLQELSGEEKKKNISVIDIDPGKLAQYGAADSDMCFRLYQVLKKELKKEKLEKLLHEIEVPLIPVLARMERNGILLDVPFLKQLHTKLKRDIASLEKRIYAMAGREFNIASPLQMKEILFQDLKIDVAGIKRKKTGLSTAASELEKLKDKHEIVPLLLEYREVTKLVNTYVSTLPDLINKDDKRVHTTFNQTIAATGRLSSVNPNLQNIPVRTELGREIRKAFIAPRGHELISADYSQIELRLAAVISKDPKMLDIFKAGKDIHSSTAAEINGIPIERVTPDQRRKAKEVNFGVIYGLGSTGLAQRTGISRLEAKQFIEAYFTLFKGLKTYLTETKQKAHEQGYIETLYGRRRLLPEIHSTMPMLVAQAERMAINMPFQGTAADLIKIAMIHTAELLREKAPSARMLLQVHDELVFEVPKDEVLSVSRLIKRTMESAARFDIPLIVDVKAGKNWNDMKPVSL